MAEKEIREIGVPVRSVNWVRLHAGRAKGGGACLYATMGQQADNLFVLQIDPETGEFRQFVAAVPNSPYPTTTLMSRTGRLYIGAAYSGHLLCFDPEMDALLDLGAIHPEAAVFVCRMDEDTDGRIWIGSYDTADLTCFDPRSESFIHHGRMDGTDMYNYPLVNTNSTVANLIRMTEPHVVVFDPETGRKECVGPVVPKGEGAIDLRRGADGLLYIASSKGDYRLDGWEAVPVDAAPEAAAQACLPDGSTFGFADGEEQTHRKLEVRTPSDEVRIFELAYEASGSEIFYLHAGPDGCIYGSSVLPLHLFRYSPEDGSLANLGKCSTADGEAYSMGNLDGNMYISAYPGSTMSVYDPTRPYHFGDTPQDNPLDLGRIDDISYRPRSTLTGPMGRVWVASVPDYGRWGGPLSYYDPSTGEKKAYYRIVGDGSCYSLAHLQAQELLAVGTTISGGSGTQPKVDQAVLFLFDYRKEEKVWEGALERGVHEFNALVVAPDGRLFGTATGGGEPLLFVFDPEAQTFTEQMPLPEGEPLDLGLQLGPDGHLYGFTSTCIYRLAPRSLEIEVLARDRDGFGVAGPILGPNIYFGTNHRLRAIELF